MLNTEADYHTDQGDRDDNEDSAVVVEGGSVCAVADGMGGQRAGEVASRLAVETVQQRVADGELGALSKEEEVHQWLGELFREANQRILTAGRDKPELLDMGTTLTLALVAGERLFFAHLGDSRLYLWRAGQTEQLTEDHTEAQEFVRQGWLLPEEAARSRYRHVLSKCLGTSRAVEPQLGGCALRAGDRLLLCSDGLYGEVPPDHLNGLLGETLAAKELAVRLVAAARHSGRSELDNITALVVHLR